MSYYVIKLYGLVCDVCEASEEYVPRVDEERRLSATRRALAGPPSFWSYVAGKDICSKVDDAHSEARRQAAK